MKNALARDNDNYEKSRKRGILREQLFAPIPSNSQYIDLPDPTSDCT